MKKLQNNFTTVEQSKRLLELEVPANSADCFIDLRTGTIYHCQDKTYSEIVNNYDELGLKRDEFSPCWSVGRLIEIYEICTGRIFNRLDVYTVFADVFTSIESLILNKKFDFSKLEE